MKAGILFLWALQFISEMFSCRILNFSIGGAATDDDNEVEVFIFMSLMGYVMMVMVAT